MAKKKTVMAHRKASKRYCDKLKESGLVRFYRFVTSEEKMALDQFLKNIRESNASSHQNQF